MNLPNCIAIFLLSFAVVSGIAAQPLENEVDVEINRLEAKYTGNKTMILTLAKLRRSWKDFQDSQCFFEKTAASGGKVQKNPPPEAAAAFKSCKARTDGDVKAALAKF